jgi:hypothetical protein
MSLDKLIASFEAEKNQKKEAPEEKKAKEPKPLKQKTEKKAVATAKEVKTVKEPAPVVGASLDFLTSMASPKSMSSKKTVHVDTKLYETLVLIKRKKGISNVGIIIDTIIERFIEDNKAEIKTMLRSDDF